MPEAAVAAPPTTSSATPQPSGSAVPSSRGEIHVVPQPVAPDVPKAGSAKDRMFQDLRKKAKPPESPAAAVAPQKPAAAPKSTDAGTVNQVELDDNPAPGEAAAAPHSNTKPGDGKVSPWKLVDEYKKRVADAEAKLAEVTKNRPNEDLIKQQQAEFEATKKRRDELEEEIRYVNYTKSAEFRDKYQQPYEQAWSRAMAELKEIPVTDPSTGEARTVDPQDMLQLVNMPLGQARDVAEQMFGKFADDVMAHRKEIRHLFDAQSAALEEARKSGAEREKLRAAQMQEYQTKAAKLVGETWQKANEAVVKDEKFGKYFTPVDGDQEGNDRLSKGFAFVDKAFAENPFAPNLKPEERQAIIRRHAAVRHRAAAFGRMVAQQRKMESKIAELETELKQYRASEPPSDGGAAPAGTAQPASAMERTLQALRQRAK